MAALAASTTTPAERPLGEETPVDKMKQASAFRVAVQSQVGPQVMASAEIQEVAPLSDPEETGKLEYPIDVVGYRTSALLDHGASASFISEAFCERLGLATAPLHSPMCLQEFSGTGPTLTKKARAGRVDFAGYCGPWTFVVAPTPPLPIVVGLDMIRAWQLCYNPANDGIHSPRSSRLSRSLGRVALHRR